MGKLIRVALVAVGVVLVFLWRHGYQESGKPYVACGFVVLLLSIVALVLGSMRAGRARHRVIERLEDADPPGGAVAGDPEPTTGLWNGVRIKIDNLRVEVPLEKWSPEMTAETRRRRCAASHLARTGDPLFDEWVCIGNSDDAVWRCILTPEPRALLAKLCKLARIRIRRDVATMDDVPAVLGHSQFASFVLEATLSMIRCDKFEAVVDLAVAFAASVPELTGHPPTNILTLAKSEPMADVRAGHYRWLAGTGWNTQQVYHAAAADPDPSVAAWGANHLPRSEGTFR